MALTAPALAHRTPVLLRSAPVARPAAERQALGGRLTTLAADGASLIGMVLALPFLILAVGTPLALLVVGLLWAGRALQNAF